MDNCIYEDPAMLFTLLPTGHLVCHINDFVLYFVTVHVFRGMTVLLPAWCVSMSVLCRALCRCGARIRLSALRQHRLLTFLKENCS